MAGIVDEQGAVSFNMVGKPLLEVFFEITFRRMLIHHDHDVLFRIAHDLGKILPHKLCIVYRKIRFGKFLTVALYAYDDGI